VPPSMVRAAATTAAVTRHREPQGPRVELLGVAPASVDGMRVHLLLLALLYRR
jgi:hypothetical protein